MKYQQIYEDVSNMGFEAVVYVFLAVAVWVLLKLFHTCFAFPRALSRQQDVQKLLEDKINDYEKYLKDCEEKERAAGVDPTANPDTASRSGLNGTPPDNSQSYEEKWKERREFLEMLKKELKRVRDGGDSYDWGNLLDDDEDEKKKTNDSDAVPSTSAVNDFEQKNNDMVNKNENKNDDESDEENQEDEEEEEEEEMDSIKDVAGKKDD